MELLSEQPSLASTAPEHSRPHPERHIVRAIFLGIIAALLPLSLIYILHRTTEVTESGVIQWELSLLILYIATNILVGISVLGVVVRLYRLAEKRQKTVTFLWPLIGIGVFSISNGMVHGIVAAAGGKPLYWLATSIQYISGIMALGLAIAIPPLMPSFSRLLKSAGASDRNKNMLESTNIELLKANETLQMEIVERKKAEDSQRAHLERVRGIIDNLPVGAIAFDETDRVLHANDLFSQLFELGIEANSLIGHHSQEFTDLLRQQIRHQESYVRMIANLSASKQQTLGTEILFNDGRVIAQDFIPLFANGVYTGQLFLYRDITREKRIDATKSEFMSLASHQLRTPLTTMRWSLGRLGKSIAQRINTAEERLVQEARSAAGRMAHTIDTMLAISRVEAGKISLEISEIKLGNTINEVRTEIREQYELKHQLFTIDCAPGMHVRTDAYVFKEILRNLFTNAIKYTPDHGKIHVRVTALQQHVQIDLSDTGYGIPTHQQEKIFSKFFRGDNIIQRDTEGTGLGLYLVFLLVKLLGATIFFVSEEQKGTTFTLLLPLQTTRLVPPSVGNTVL